MIKITLSFAFSACFFLHAAAQNPGCDGSRYIDDVFTSVKKTTVEYAVALNQINQEIHLKMDVYEPDGDAVEARPVVILAHGGTFIFGDKADMKAWCERLAKKGYVAVSIQYRLYPFFPLGYPDSVAIFDAAVRAVGDMKCAVRYFREDAAGANLFRADANNIFVGGYSAGAVAALHAGYLDENDQVPPFIQTILNTHGGLNGNTGTTSNQAYSSSVKAVVNMSGGLYRSNWADSLNIPLSSIHGDADATVPYISGLAANIAYLEGSGLIHQSAESAGLLNELITVPGGGHTNIYEASNAQYVPYIDSFWVKTATLLEFLTCATVDAPVLGDGEENWNFYPNPASEGVFYVQLPEAVQRASLTLTDIYGKMVLHSRSLQSGEAIRVNGLPAGIYAVQIADMENPGRLFRVKKLVLNH